jgi:hypothetical protein
MNRASFLKSLISIAVSPKILAEVNVPAATPKTVALFADLHHPTGDYYRMMVEKYGTESYAMFEQVIMYGSPSEEFYHFEKRRDDSKG